MVMLDQITAQERLNFETYSLDDLNLSGRECMGCGRTAEEIIENDTCTPEQLEDNSRTTLCGNWYCHLDCFRDSH